MRPSHQVYNIFFDMVLETLKQFNKEPIQTQVSIKLELSDHYLNLFLSGGMQKCSLVLFIYPLWETRSHGHDDFYDFPFPLFIKVIKVMYSYHINNFKNDVFIEFYCDSLFYRYHYMIIYLLPTYGIKWCSSHPLSTKWIQFLISIQPLPMQ